MIRTFTKWVLYLKASAIIFLVACSSITASAIDLHRDTIKSVSYNITNKSERSETALKDAVFYILKKQGDTFINVSDITSVKFARQFLAKGIGEISTYKVKFSDSLPDAYESCGILVIDKVKKKLYLFDLSTVEPIKLKQSSLEYYFAGRYMRRRYGVFKAFDFKRGFATDIFTSPDFISNDSEDCISYKNGDLKLFNIDFNKDGFLDLEFEGTEDFYCNGKEVGYGKFDRHPIRTKKIRLFYLFDNYKMSWR